MPFLIKADLTTHLYPEIIDEIIRKYLLEYANLAAFPAVGVAGYTYQDNSNSNLYRWSLTAYVPATDPDNIVTTGISSAIDEAKGYLNRFDLVAIFGTADDDPTVAAPQLEHLKSVVKELACWKLIKLANPNVDLKLFRTGYEDAIAWLTKVQKGQVDPEGWPYKPDDPATPGNENSGIQWSSNKKRTQHF
jgi:hypothetical protein